MVNRFLVNLLFEYGARVGKSVIMAYQKAVNSPQAQQSGFGKVASETFGRLIVKPMTRDEALKILSIEEAAEIDPIKVMERFETLFQKNMPDKGGSFYIQSKVYFAKEHIMQDFPSDLNVSKFNPNEDGSQQSAETNEVPNEGKDNQSDAKK